MAGRQENGGRMRSAVVTGIATGIGTGIAAELIPRRERLGAERVEVRQDTENLRPACNCWQRAQRAP